jgi:peptide chain release factor 1
MFTEWEKLKSFYAEITSELSQEHLEQKRRTALQKKASHVSAVLSQYDEVEKTKQALQQAQAQVSEQKDPEFKDLFMQEVKDLQERLIVHEKALEEVLYPVDELADRDAYLEIRAGTGGQEAALFAGDLAKMYMHYADKKGWKVEISSESKTDLGGYKEIVLFIKGKDVKKAVAKGQATSISASTLIIDKGGKFSQTNVSTALKKVCEQLIEKLKL